MIPREIFRIHESPYVIDAGVYRRFDARKTGFVLVGLQDTGEVAPHHWLNKMQRKMMDNIAKGVKGKSRSDYALTMGAEAVNFIIGSYGDQNANKQFLKWAPLFIPHFLSKSPIQVGPDRLTSFVKSAAKFYGADLIGVTELNRGWVHDRNIHKPFLFREVTHPEETDEGFIIPKAVNRAIVMALEMNRQMISESPQVAEFAATDLGYSKMAWLVVMLAEYIRALGYQAIPCMNDTALSIPLAIDAGLGQAGRNGLLITPEYGPCVRLCKVLTDMPLETDQPINFGLTEFCKQCLACAKACPVGAISFGDQTFMGVGESNNPGVQKWFVDAEKCLRFWQENGGSCANCVAACPFTLAEELASTQCMECEKCVAPDCPVQSIAREQSKYRPINK